jgi:hypothetical protein
MTDDYPLNHHWRACRREARSRPWLRHGGNPRRRTPARSGRIRGAVHIGPTRRPTLVPPCDVCKLVKGIEAVPAIGKTLRTLR